MKILLNSINNKIRAGKILCYEDKIYFIEGGWVYPLLFWKVISLLRDEITLPKYISTFPGLRKEFSVKIKNIGPAISEILRCRQASSYFLWKWIAINAAYNYDPVPSTVKWNSWLSRSENRMCSFCGNVFFALLSAGVLLSTINHFLLVEKVLTRNNK